MCARHNACTERVPVRLRLSLHTCILLDYVYDLTQANRALGLRPRRVIAHRRFGTARAWCKETKQVNSNGVKLSIPQSKISDRHHTVYRWLVS